MDISKLVLNPARLRILQYLRLHGRARTSAIVEYLGDVPRATAYRHVKLLEEGGLVEVVEERRVRGAVEKVYALAEAALPLQGEAAVAVSTVSFLDLMQEMNEYLSGDACDCERDRVLFQTALLQVTDDEYAQLMRDLADVLKPYVALPPAPDRTLRKLSIVSSPPGACGPDGLGGAESVRADESETGDAS